MIKKKPNAKLTKKMIKTALEKERRKCYICGSKDGYQDVMCGECLILYQNIYNRFVDACSGVAKKMVIEKRGKLKPELYKDCRDKKFGFSNT